MVLFFGLVFTVAPTLGKFSADALGHRITQDVDGHSDPCT